MFFQGWEGLLRVAVVGPAAYVGLILILRLSGKRTLSKMNAFDLIITIALGSTLATVILSKRVALAEGMFALALLVFFQFVATWSAVRSEKVRKLISSEPTLLFYRGQFLYDAMQAQRITKSEVLHAARSQGVSDLSNQMVVLETDGRLSVTPFTETSTTSSVSDIREKSLSDGCSSGTR